MVRRLNFYKWLKDELGLENVEIVTSRAEDFISDEKRESYDLGLCRGVSKLSTILEYIIPFLKRGRNISFSKNGGNWRRS